MSVEQWQVLLCAALSKTTECWIYVLDQISRGIHVLLISFIFMSRKSVASCSFYLLCHVLHKHPQNSQNLFKKLI